jgi:hypothetical protein
MIPIGISRHLFKSPHYRTGVIPKKGIAQAAEATCRIEQWRSLEGVPGGDFLRLQLFLKPALLFRDLVGHRQGTFSDGGILLYSRRSSVGHGYEYEGNEDSLAKMSLLLKISTSSL